ncbi:hypothetical protein BJY00DRAFT_292254 [Aspergillus carlsbadensis]|nr:hypothetical protein BJY00DRAFT_292254 [Aspergillus carlsbadensis]
MEVRIKRWSYSWAFFGALEALRAVHYPWNSNSSAVDTVNSEPAPKPRLLSGLLGAGQCAMKTLADWWECVLGESSR